MLTLSPRSEQVDDFLRIAGDDVRLMLATLGLRLRLSGLPWKLGDEGVRRDSARLCLGDE